MAKLQVSVAQMAVIRSKPAENLEKGEGLISEAAKLGSSLICFPEMWTTGFDWAANKRIAPLQEQTISAIASMARRFRIWINGSVLSVDEKGKMANTSILFDSNGRVAGSYRKAHLFNLIHEDRHMSRGNSICAAAAPWGLTGLSVCYDIRFPELYRTYALKGVKVQLVPAAFPSTRLQHWKVLLLARAIENQMFVIAANQVGSEDLGAGGIATYCGNSAIIDPWGEAIAQADDTHEVLLTAAIDTDKVDEIRSKMTVLTDRRPELYKLG